MLDARGAEESVGKVQLRCNATFTVRKGTAPLKEGHLRTPAFPTNEQVRNMEQVRNEDMVFVVLRDHSLMGTGGVRGQGAEEEFCKGTAGDSGESWRGPISILWSFRFSAVPRDPCAAGTPVLVLQHL